MEVLEAVCDRYGERSRCQARVGGIGHHPARTGDRSIGGERATATQLETGEINPAYWQGKQGRPLNAVEEAAEWKAPVKRPSNCRSRGLDPLATPNRMLTKKSGRECLSRTDLGTGALAGSLAPSHRRDGSSALRDP